MLWIILGIVSLIGAFVLIRYINKPMTEDERRRIWNEMVAYSKLPKVRI